MKRTLPEEVAALDVRLLDVAGRIIASADWSTQTAEWRTSAEKFLFAYNTRCNPPVTAAAALLSMSHAPRCLCAACRARRTAGLPLVQPTQLPTSGQREPERAAEGAARSAGERSKAAARPFCALVQLTPGDGKGKRLVCELAPGHPGMHRDGEWSWLGTDGGSR